MENQQIDSPNKVFSRILIYVPVMVFAVLMLLPYYWMVIGAFKSVPELSQVPPTFTVEDPTLNNYYNPDGIGSPDEPLGLFQRYEKTPGGFGRYFLNSTVVSFSVTIGTVIIASLAAFVIAKHKFPGRQFIFILFIASMMIPWPVTLVTNFLVVKELGWLNTYTAMIVPAIPRAFVLFFLRQYMMSLPDDLLDAARVDGASEFRIWWRVVLPLIGPALVAMSIFVFLVEWNNLVWPLVVLQNEDMRTLPVVLSTLIDPFSGANDQGVAMAAAFLVSLPTLIMFVIFQRQFVRGIALTGLKG